MREIKFRAFNKTENKFHDFVEVRIVPKIKTNILDFTIPDDEDIIVQQYTGLKDSKGREIYEGDIVEFVVDEPLAENEEKRIIVAYVDFDRGSFWLNTKKRFYDGTNYTDETLLLNFAYCCKVIGNIFENPELLEK